MMPKHVDMGLDELLCLLTMAKWHKCYGSEFLVSSETYNRMEIAVKHYIETGVVSVRDLIDRGLLDA